MGNEVHKNQTLKGFLSQGGIEIPIIQRDYAYGRSGESNAKKREKFLGDIKSALDDNKLLNLDFVYGTNSTDDVFQPLDGQQRLTTLWLIHWYLLFATEDIEKNKQWIERFSYRVRYSSEKFCKKLCEMNKDDFDKYKKAQKNKAEYTLADYIKSRPWFYAEWIQDPTINSMLRALSGEKENEKGPDCIEGIFDVRRDKKNKYKKRLGLDDASEAIIRFHLFSPNGIPDTDDLYVKMNAGGKPLTDFENFKADLITCINANKELEDAQYPYKIDNDWTNIFWENRPTNNEIDDMFLMFINRFVFSRATEDINIKKTINEDKEKKEFISRLYNDHTFEYNSLDFKNNYSRYFTAENLEELNKLFIFLKEDAAKEIKEIIKISSWLPEYDEKNNKIKQTTQKERVYFTALLCFLGLLEDVTKDLADDEIRENFFDWMHVCRNLIENSRIDTLDAMEACDKTIRRLGKELEKRKNIYEVLAEQDLDEKSKSKHKEQCNEEIIKAKIITADKCGWLDIPDPKVRKETRKKEIQKREDEKCFGGAIRFLLLDEEGQYPDLTSGSEWGKIFDTKHDNTNLLFEKNGDAKPETLKAFREKIIRRPEEIDGLCIFSLVGDSTRNFSWKKSILLDTKYVKQTDMLLRGEESKDPRDIKYDSLLQRTELIKDLEAKTKEMSDEQRKDYVVTVDKLNHEISDIHLNSQNSQNYIYLGDDRARCCEIFKRLQDNGKLDCENEFIDGYYLGKTIEFNYPSGSNQLFSWYRDEQEHEEYIRKKEKGKKKNRAGDAKWESIHDEKELLSALNSLLKS